jgi:hypothetical protein
MGLASPSLHRRIAAAAAAAAVVVVGVVRGQGLLRQLY